MKTHSLPIIIVLALVLFHPCQSQVVISEYFNARYPSGEWTEILECMDGVTVTGIILRDNAASGGAPNKWQGGIMFKNKIEWSHLRGGTIIVINHRGTDLVDINARDGYIELGAENEDFFEKMCYDATPDNWYYRALSIAQEADIVELAHSLELNHQHSLSHMAVPGGDYLSIPINKANYEGTISDSSSVRVISDEMGDGYYAGSGTTHTYAGRDYVTKGLPNVCPYSFEENQKFWRRLREPHWYMQTHVLLAFPYSDRTKLLWTKINDPCPWDSIQGYIIVRFPAKDSLLALHPLDGKIYAPGEKLGSATVVALINHTTDTSFTDNFNINCGESYIYRHYLYRYDADDLGMDTSPETARGRQYTQSEYMDVLVEKKLPEKPLLAADRTSICQGDTADIRFGYKGINNSFQWYIDGKPVIGENKDHIRACREGKYTVEISDSLGCSSYSDTLEIKVVPSSEARLFVNGREVLRDTSISVCMGFAVTLKVTSQADNTWYKDKTIFSHEDIITTTSGGEYYAVADNSACPDTTPSVRIKFIDINYSCDSKSVDFYVNKSQTEDVKDLTVENLSEDTLRLGVTIQPGNFRIISPNPPFVVPPTSKQVFTIRFQPAKPGTTYGSIIFETDCKKQEVISLNGIKESQGIEADVTKIDFGTLVNCDNQFKDTVFNVTNKSTEKITINLPITDWSFLITGPAFPIEMLPGTSTGINVRFKPITGGSFISVLLLPYMVSNYSDTIRVTLSGNSLLPAFRIEPGELTLPPLSNCQEYMDTTVTIINTGTTDLTISHNIVSQDIAYTNLPITVKAGEAADLGIRFKPLDAGTFHFNLDVTAEPCEITNSISISAKKTGIAFTLDKDTIDFGTIVSCGPMGSKDSVFSLILSGDIYYKPKIKSVNCSGMFSSDLSLGMELNDTNIIAVRFNPDKEGEFTGSLKILIEPCDIEKTVFLKGIAVSPSFTVDKNKLDFGITSIGGTVERTLSVSNTCKVGIEINSIEGIKPPYYISPANPSLPLRLEPGGKLDYKLEYVPDDILRDDLLISIRIAWPCELASTVTLTGNGWDKGSYKAEARMPSGLSGSIGERAAIPVLLKPVEPASFNDFRIDSIKAVLKFNPTVLYPESVSAGNLFINNNPSRNEFTEPVPGTVEIMTIPPNYSSFAASGNMAELNCRLLLGNSNKTKLHIDTVIIYAERPVAVVLVDDSLYLEGDCAFNSRFAELGGAPGIILRSDGIVNDVIKLDMIVTSEDRTMIALYNSVGGQMKIIADKNFTPGVYNYEIPVSGLGSGMYFIRMQVAGFVDVKKVIVVNQ